MTPRKRIHRGMVDNLYHNKVKNKTYYRYIHPITGKSHSMGSNKAQAVAAARILNSKLVPEENSMILRVLGTHEKDFRYLIDRFRNEHLPTKNLAAGTLRSYNYRLDRLLKDLGNTQVRAHTIESIADYLDNNFEKSPYVKYRTTMGELFRFAMLKGLRNDNPVTTTYAKTNIKKVRQRMTLEQFKALHAIAPHGIQIAMELSLVALLGRHEVCNLKYSDERDGGLFVIRKKSEKNEWARLKIEMNPEISDIIKRSRSDGLVSPFVVHRRPKRCKESKEKEHWTQYPLHKFTTDFRSLRDDSGIFDDIPKDERPTFHEIRSLGSWLYEQANFETEYVQQLMAHGDPSMTKYYQSGHEEKWMEVKADLGLKSILKSTV